jgi:hypothetical protein
MWVEQWISPLFHPHNTTPFVTLTAGYWAIPQPSLQCSGKLDMTVIRNIRDFIGTPIEMDLIDGASFCQKIPQIHVSTIHGCLLQEWHSKEASGPICITGGVTCKFHRLAVEGRTWAWLGPFEGSGPVMDLSTGGAVCGCTVGTWCSKSGLHVWTSDAHHGSDPWLD